MGNFLDRKLIDKSGGPKACWEWQGARDKGGYCVTKHGGRMGRAHSFAWEAVNGPKPDGWDWCICHHCDNPPCCNPAHLWLGTRKQNIHDMMMKGRHPRPKGESAGNSKLTDRDVLEIVAAKLGGESQHSISRRFSMTQPAIHYICTGRTWSHVTGIKQRAKA